MLVPKQLINRINEIVDRAYLDFTFDIIGADFLSDEQKIKMESLGLIIGRRPLIELLYLVARQRSTPGYKQDQTLNELLNEIIETNQLPSVFTYSQESEEEIEKVKQKFDQVKMILPPLTPAEEYTITNAKLAVDEAVSKTKETLKASVIGIISQTNLQHKEKILQTPIQDQLTVTGESKNELLQTITYAALGVAAVSTFKKLFTKATTEAVNTAVVDELREELGAADKVGQDPLVYKQIVDDNVTSPECRRLHTTNGSGANPRIYKLSELISNGSNAGKPRSAWKAVIGGTHPNCRCQLKKATPDMLKKLKES